MLENHENAERKLRQKMRVYPATSPMSNRVHDDMAVAKPREGEEENAEKRRYEDARRKAIVSVHGEDLSSENHIADAQERRSGRVRRREENAA